MFDKDNRKTNGLSSWCKACYAAKNKEWTSRHRSYYAARSRKWYWENRTRARTNAKARRIAHPERMKEYFKNWQKDNMHILLANVAKRKAQKIKATPQWANEFFMSEAYHLARLRTKMMGFVWEVDHIIPLRSKMVCGLHVEHNLQVIPAIQNRLKHNTIWPEMP
jgi:hypothetical protein